MGGNRESTNLDRTIGGIEFWMEPESHLNRLGLMEEKGLYGWGLVPGQTGLWQACPQAWGLWQAQNNSLQGPSLGSHGFSNLFNPAQKTEVLHISQS